jgi:hypothetical protein
MKMNPRYKHRRPNGVFFLIFLVILSVGLSSCGLMHKVFGPKYGCPSDGRNVGAERILGGEKVSNPKFKGGN